MATCPDNTCGTGGWTGPLPGDPDNNSTLHAQAAFGGIDVSWSYPVANPFAVAHTLLYRGVTNNYAAAVQRAVVSGNQFYDKVDTGTTYYYWIQIVSVNGTVGDAIGPASATARTLVAHLIEQLTGEIDSGLLATSLRNELDQLSVLNTNLANEIFDREEGMTSFAAALLDVQDGLAEAHTFIANETNSRTSENEAIIESVDLLAVTLGDSVAAVVENTSAWITEINGKVTDIGALYTMRLTVNDLIGGFGVYNDGTTVEAGFDVDRFWIGRTDADKRKPFIVDGGVVYIDEAFIRELTADIINGGTLTASNVNLGSGTFMVNGTTGFASMSNTFSSVAGFGNLWNPSLPPITSQSYSGSSAPAGKFTAAAGNAIECYGPAYVTGNLTVGGTMVGNASTATYANTSGQVVNTGNAALKALSGTHEAIMQTDGNFGVYNYGAIMGSSNGGFPSDVKLKSKVNDYVMGGLATINALKVRTYWWKLGTAQRRMKGLEKQVGFIANEVQEVLPHLVTKHTGPDGKDTLLLNKTEMIPFMVKAIQELSQEVSQLKAQLLRITNTVN